MMQQAATNYGSVDGAASPHLVLASSSPRRRELLALLGVPFVVEPSRYIEPAPPAHAIRLADFVMELATNKAIEVAGRTSGGYIIGADTLVTVDQGDLGVPLGKPTDADDAARMLGLLSGRVHCVYTGVAIVPVPQDGTPQEPCRAIVRTLVKFRQLDAAMIADYVATGEPLDKAGAYGAQGYAAPFIEGFEGDFYNVVGLPLATVGLLLEELGLPWWRYRQQMPTLIG
jgi:septum formation protein